MAFSSRIPISLALFDQNHDRPITNQIGLGLYFLLSGFDQYLMLKNGFLDISLLKLSS
jgi:hypothetical protein